jgi:hypothetical protein
MFLSLLLIFTFLPQEYSPDSLDLYPVFFEKPVKKISTFRGEPYIFEVTQPYIQFDEKSLSFFIASNKGVVPHPLFLEQYPTIDDIPFQSATPFPPYLSQEQNSTFIPSPLSLSAGTLGIYPSYPIVKKFRKEIPFSQIQLFRDKEENEHMQFTFGRNITQYVQFNVAADYIDRSPFTERSFGFDADVALPFNTTSHFLLIDTKNDSVSQIDDKLLAFTLSRKQGSVTLYRKTLGGIDELGTLSDLYLNLPFQRITLGFDYPNFDSIYYQTLVTDIINPFPLLYIVPRFVIDSEKDYLSSLGIGYHTMVDIFVYGNILVDKDQSLFSSIGIRSKSENHRFEGFLFSKNEEVKDNSGAVLFYNGEFFTNFHLLSTILARGNGNHYFYVQPLLQRSFKQGNLKPGIFWGIEYDHMREGNELVMNAGIILEIIDVDLYFIFDDIDNEDLRQYKFGVRWDFFD